MKTFQRYDLENLKPDSKLVVETRNTLYSIKRGDDGRFVIKGNASYCPEYSTLYTKVIEVGGILMFASEYTRFGLGTATTSKIEWIGEREFYTKCPDCNADQNVSMSKGCFHCVCGFVQCERDSPENFRSTK